MRALSLLLLALAFALIAGCTNAVATIGAYSSTRARVEWPFVPPDTSPKAPRLGDHPEDVAELPSLAGDACVACVNTSCRDEATACLADEACACLVICRSATGDSTAHCSSSTSCNRAPDVAYAASASCVAHHCAAQCPRLP